MNHAITPIRLKIFNIKLTNQNLSQSTWKIQFLHRLRPGITCIKLRRCKLKKVLKAATVKEAWNRFTRWLNRSSQLKTKFRECKQKSSSTMKNYNLISFQTMKSTILELKYNKKWLNINSLSTIKAPCSKKCIVMPFLWSTETSKLSKMKRKSSSSSMKLILISSRLSKKQPL